MRKVFALFYDKRTTMFMQHADVFERSKVVRRPLLTVTLKDGVVVNDQWVEKFREQARLADVGDTEGLVAIFDTEKVHYCDPDIKSVSDGETWCLLSDFIEAIQMEGHRINVEA